jgi:hypothetical protein
MTFDNVDKIDCSVEANYFFKKYIEKRKPVFLLGCQEKWRAKNWTIEGNKLSLLTTSKYVLLLT